jgi:predicted transposase/invertase (TIGR01784 family)
VNEFNDVATTPIEEWLDYLKNGRIKDDTVTPGLAEAREKLQYMQMNRADQLAYERHLDALAVQSDAFDAARVEGRAEGLEIGRLEGRAKGIEEGRAEGRAEGVLAIAKNLKQMGLSVSDIIKATGLNSEEIDNL